MVGSGAEFYKYDGLTLIISRVKWYHYSIKVDISLQFCIIFHNWPYIYIAPTLNRFICTKNALV